MPHVVLTTFGSLGDLHPYMALGRELQKRGHRATLATSEMYRVKVESEGLGFHAVRPDFPELGESAEVTRKAMDLRHGTKYVVCELMLSHLTNTYEDVDQILPEADLVVTHTLSFAAHLWAEKHRIPWVSTVLQPTAMFSVYDPSVLAPAPWLSQGRWLGPLLYRPLYAAIRRELRSWMGPVHELRRTLGLPETSKDPILDGQFSTQCNLGLFSPELASPQRDWPPNTHLTGFPFYDEARNANAVPRGLSSFLKSGDAPIVFTLGSSAVMHAGDFYRDSVDAANRLGKRSVLLVGQDPDNVPQVRSADIFSCEYAPHSELFPHAAAVVHQGGIGTTAQALRSGKPMLVVPYGQDQPDNAARVVRAGVGRTVPRASYNDKRAFTELTALLGNRSYAERAMDIGDRIRSENGAREAVDRILGILAL